MLIPLPWTLNFPRTPYKFVLNYLKYHSVSLYTWQDHLNNNLQLNPQTKPTIQWQMKKTAVSFQINTIINSQSTGSNDMLWICKFLGPLNPRYPIDHRQKITSGVVTGFSFRKTCNLLADKTNFRRWIKILQALNSFKFFSPHMLENKGSYMHVGGIN